AENEDFAEAVQTAGLTYVGPSPKAIALMGSKTAARTAAARAGVPIVPGNDGPVAPDASDAEIEKIAATIGYPLLVKASPGGGGKGMCTWPGPSELRDGVRAALSEAGAGFGDSAISIERQLI